MFQIVTQRCKNPENSRQQRILTPSTKENANWTFWDHSIFSQFVHI